jgi:hypothetical protein
MASTGVDQFVHPRAADVKELGNLLARLAIDVFALAFAVNGAQVDAHHPAAIGPERNTTLSDPRRFTMVEV